MAVITSLGVTRTLVTVRSTTTALPPSMVRDTRQAVATTITVGLQPEEVGDKTTSQSSVVSGEIPTTPVQSPDTTADNQSR